MERIDFRDQIARNKRNSFFMIVLIFAVFVAFGYVIAKILGPKGVMPNPKTGTVGANIGQMVKEIAGGKVNFKNDDSGNIHQIIGKSNFESKQLLENFKAFYDAVVHAKPSTVKGQYIVSVSMNATMGPGIKLKV